MEIEKNPPEIAKKLWNIVRVLLYMMRKSISKSKILMVDIHMRGKIASKAIGNYLMLHHQHHYSALTCRSNDINTSFVSPRDYEFSCSNTPVVTKRKNHHRQAQELKVMRKVFDILNRYDVDVNVETTSSSPKVRQLRVTDSPFMIKETDGNSAGQVDKDAEEFINNFYKDLMNQRKIAALESPSPYHHLWAT